MLAFAAIALLGCTVDLATKNWVFAWKGLPPPFVHPGEHTPWWLIEPYVGIETALNTGALFGMGQNLVSLFAGLSVLAAVAIVGWVLFGGAARDWLLVVALGLITAGILGNLYDRLGLYSNGEIKAVRDWILFRYGNFTWPNFNLADSFLVCGAGLLVWHAMVHREDGAKKPRKLKA